MQARLPRVTARALNFADSATEGERQLTKARENQTAGLTNGRAENWAPEVAPRAFPSFPFSW